MLTYCMTFALQVSSVYRSSSHFKLAVCTVLCHIPSMHINDNNVHDPHLKTILKLQRSDTRRLGQVQREATRLT